MTAAPDAPAIHPVLLCGGAGTRLWPLSRQSYPKQFTRLLGEESLFQAAARRVVAPGFAAPLVVTGDPFRFIVTEQLAAVEQAARAILIEPEGRNTGPAVLAAALWLAARDPGALMLVAPSDHVIPDAAAFRAAVEAARPRAEAGDLVTFGIAPDRAETGYGYLELAGPVQGDGPQALAGFVEKPDAARAAEMLAGGRHLWNAGLFLFSVAAIAEAYRAVAPALYDGVAAAVAGAEADLGFVRLAPGPWAGLEDISIDYAVMENVSNLAVQPYAGHWSDLGGWEAVRQESGTGPDGNATSGPVTAIGCAGSLLRAESRDQRLVAIGLRDIVAVAMPDAVLVADRARAQEVRAAVETLKAEGAAQATAFARDHRPWGWFETLARADRFQVKRIVVDPGAALSLQSHHHRAEHWIVVSGTAKVTIGETVQLVSENQSVYVPLGARHRLENPGKVAMVLIEVQTGSYLGEDDIIRYEDVYARR